MPTNHPTPPILPAAAVAAMVERAEKASAGPWVEGVWSKSEDGTGDVQSCIIAKGRGNQVVCSGIETYDGENDGPFIAHARADLPALAASHEALRAEVERLRRVECQLLPQTADGYSIGLGSSIWGLFETEDGDRFWAVAEVTATYESTCERTIDAQMVIDRDTRIECESASYFSYAYHPETGQSADEARAAIDAQMKGADRAK